MHRLYIKATDCKCKTCDRRLKEQFTNMLDNKNIIEEIIKELTALKDTSEVSSERVLMRAQYIEEQRGKKEVFDSIRDEKEFDSVRRDWHKCCNTRQQKDNGNEK